MSTSSRRSLRCRYPASWSIAEAGSERVPLLGTAMRSMERYSFAGSGGGGAGTRAGPRRSAHRSSGSQMSVYVLRGDAPGDHHHLDVVQQLGDLLGGPVRVLVLGGH